MIMTARTGRRLAAGIALACSVILLPVTALASSAGQGSPARATAVPRCLGATGPRGTEVWTALPNNGFAGGVVYDLELSNIGRHACTLRGYPRVVAMIGSRQIGAAASHGAGSSPLVTLQPGATAHVLLQVGIPFCAHPVSAQLYVYPPGQSYGQQTDITTSICRHGRSQLGVTPIRPRTGIPFYTLS
jgi:hypothetical protein